MKLTKFLFLFLSILFISGRAFALTASYDQKISMGGKVVATIKVQSKDDLLKAESDFGGLQSIMLKNKEGLFSWLPAQKVATKIPAALDRPNLTRDIPRYMEFLKENGGQKVGSEKVGNYETDVYTFNEPNIKKPGKAWVWREKNFPVKIEVQAPEAVTTIELENINLDAKIDDSNFDLPKDVKLLDFPPRGAQANLPPASTKAEAAPKN